MNLEKFMAGTAPTGARTPQAQGLRSFGTQSMARDMTNASRRIEDIHDADDFAAARTSWLKGMTQLDEQFKEDKDFETLPKRRAEAVQKLREQTLQNVSGRVSRRLTPIFEQAAIKDGVTFGREVQRRRGEHHKARFIEDRDLLVNTVINAQGEQREQARQHLDERLQGIAPYMAETEFARMRDATHDLVSFESAKRDIPTMVAEGREFDPEQYAGLNPAQVSQLDAVYRGEVRRVQREREEHERDRLAALAPLLEDSLASAMTEGTAMDGTEEMIAELGGLGKRGQELAGKYAERFARVSRAWDVLDSVKDRPFGEQRAAVEVLRPEPGAQGYRADMDMYERAVSQVQQRAKAFADDPAGSVQAEAMRRVQAVADSWMDEETVQSLALETSLTLQKKLGAVQPKVLPRAQAARLKEEFQTADAERKIEIINQLRGYGEHARQALSEVALSHAENFAAMLYSSDPAAARAVLRTLSTDPKEFIMDGAEAKDLKTEIADEFNSGPGAVFMEQAALTGNPEYARMARELYDMTVRHSLLKGDAEAAFNELWGNVTLLDEDGLVAAQIPAELDVDSIEKGLASYREILHAQDVDGGDDPAYMEAVHDGVWINAPQGGGFVLYPKGFDGTATQNGRPIVISYAEAVRLSEPMVAVKEYSKRPGRANVVDTALKDFYLRHRDDGFQSEDLEYSHVPRNDARAADAIMEGYKSIRGAGASSRPLQYQGVPRNDERIAQWVEQNVGDAASKWWEEQVLSGLLSGWRRHARNARERYGAE